MALGYPLGPAFENDAKSQVQYLADPVTTDGVFGFDTLRIIDEVYSQVRGKPFGSP
jgi:hypothetical protein